MTECQVEISIAVENSIFMPDVRGNLYELATDQERNFDYGLRGEGKNGLSGKIGWFHQETSRRWVTIINTTIGISAITGTLIWAYFG